MIFGFFIFYVFFLVLPGISFWMIFETSHELEGVTSGYFLDGELPQQSSITNVMQHTESEITTKLKTAGSGAVCPVKPPVPGLLS